MCGWSSIIQNGRNEILIMSKVLREWIDINALQIGDEQTMHSLRGHCKQDNKLCGEGDT